MVRYAIVAFAGLAAALPLNINLGAYSPALVVGDGEISFGGRQDVSNLITALEGAAVNAAAGAANAANAGGESGVEGGTSNAAAVAAPDTASTAVVPTQSPTTVENASVDNTNTDPALTAQAEQIAGLQGLGKAIAPRVGESETNKVGKRDLAGFDRALTYAEAALTKGPKIELGTGAEGSGIGIIVDNTPGGAAEKRDINDATSAPRRRAKVTTMYVRRGIPAALNARSGEGNNEAVVARSSVLAPDQAAPPVPVPVVISKRDMSVLDAVNLNVDGDAGVTMTFVESVEDEADDDVEDEEDDQ
ncbi:hypothetical protein P885DRAFT_68541 [Corynascus similis CBS 632.67]